MNAESSLELRLPSHVPLEDDGYFLPPAASAKGFASPIYQPWETLASRLPALIESRELQMEVQKLPVLSTGSLCSDLEWREAYVVLCFLANGYIWASSLPVDTLPPALSVPLLEVAGRLELPPVATYAGLVLWNYTNTESNGFRPESLQVRYTFTGTSDEAWFYLISVAIEAEGRHVVRLGFCRNNTSESSCGKWCGGPWLTAITRPHFTRWRLFPSTHIKPINPYSYSSKYAISLYSPCETNTDQWLTSQPLVSRRSARSSTEETFFSYRRKVNGQTGRSIRFPS
ncbi:indoleamine-dioxygenase [Colletotrichum chrysophilum]|uniref:Indoleamine-dioxygenase n=1 Tax=Colletotrichum chrysophilum TaxID=1836956 RepID=A0AAD8ZZ53_9PEZI|nr:indoleamine-dioxygenase [Colletotrichum chrysophilum]